MSNVSETFNLCQHGPEFERYIRRLRDLVRDPSQPPLSNNHPNHYMLRPFRTVPEQWLHLRMEVADGDAAIILWVRTDNLYVIGFEQASGGRRWEFGTSNNPGEEEKEKAKTKTAKKKQEQREQRQQLIPRSTPLGFGGGYRNLGDLRLEPDDYAERIIGDIGWNQLEYAIRSLAQSQPAGTGVRHWLRTIIITVIESIRSDEVCTHVDTLLREYRSGWLNQRMILIIRNWKKISACVILASKTQDSPELYKAMSRICGNTNEACQAVAILNHGPSIQQEEPSRRRRPKREAMPHAVNDVPEGLTFVEIFAMVTVNIDSEDPGDLYGTITVNDGLKPEVLFRRGRSEIQFVGPGGLVELTGPNRAIWGYDEVVFDLDLKDADCIPDMSPDDEISKGQMIWNTYERPEEDYNKVKEYLVEGVSGAVNICYAMITNAVVATVVVDLTNGDNERYPDLYGTITAGTSAFPSVSHKIKLFNRDWKHPVSMPAGQSIQLLRNVVVVQLGSSLKINADLWDRDLLPDASPDDHIANGEAEFGASIAGTTSKVILGRHGAVTVHVMWSRT